MSTQTTKQFQQQQHQHNHDSDQVQEQPTTMKHNRQQDSMSGNIKRQDQKELAEVNVNNHHQHHLHQKSQGGAERSKSCHSQCQCQSQVRTSCCSLQSLLVSFLEESMEKSVLSHTVTGVPLSLLKRIAHPRQRQRVSHDDTHCYHVTQCQFQCMSLSAHSLSRGQKWKSLNSVLTHCHLAGSANHSELTHCHLDFDAVTYVLTNCHLGSVCDDHGSQSSKSSSLACCISRKTAEVMTKVNFKYFLFMAILKEFTLVSFSKRSASRKRSTLVWGHLRFKHVIIASVDQESVGGIHRSHTKGFKVNA
eukprot:4020821-Amphidinium_carterae.1